jgi:transcriptional regulator with XRE-family HTH domain
VSALGPAPLDAGPARARCDRKGRSRAQAHTQPAPIAELFVGSVWSAVLDRPRSPATRQRLEYRDCEPSGSDGFAVHDTGREVERDMSTARSFGEHIKSLRRARGMTQGELAIRSGLSPDTVRRLERGSFSPSLETLRKLCIGLDLLLSTLFETFEFGERNSSRELLDLLAARDPRELLLALRVLRALFEQRDALP